MCANCKCGKNSNQHSGIPAAPRNRRGFLRTALAAAILPLAACNNLDPLQTNPGDGRDVLIDGDGDGRRGDNPLRINLTSEVFAPLTSVGGIVELDVSYKVGLPPDGLYLIRSSYETIIAMNRGCTHEGCRVGSFNSQGIASCPCHDSRFDTTGKVLSGPAPEPLVKYDTSLDGDELVIHDL